MIKKVLLGLGALLGLAILGVVGKFYVASPASAPAQELTAPTDAETVEQGRYLANHVYGCLPCHSDVDEEIPGEPLKEGAKLGAGREFPVDLYGDVLLRAPNLTPHNLKDWTDGEIVRAMREGIKKDGEPIFPMMPYTVYGKVMPREHALAIVAYLRTLEPVDRDLPDSEVPFPISMFVRTAPHPVETEPPMPPEDGPERGKWLMTAMVCAECHNSVDDKRQPIPGLEYAGGVKFLLVDQVIQTPNITQDEKTGIAIYTDDEIHNAVYEGKARDGRDLYIMPSAWYAGQTETDKALLPAQVRAIKPVEHKVERLGTR